MITPEQREARRHCIGSSNAPAIVGVCPWRTPGDVYWSKISETDDKTTPAMEVGNRLEPVLLDLAEERYGPLIRNHQAAHPEYPQLVANLDAGVLGSAEIIEAKYVGSRAVDEWGDPETDEVPDHVAIQVQFQMGVTNRTGTHIPVAMVTPNGLEFRFYHVRRDDDLIDDLVTACLAFWQRHVVPKVAPPNSPPSLEVMRKIRRQPASCIDLGIEVMSSWNARENAASVKKSAESDYDRWSAEILEFLGDNEAGRLPDGRLIVYAEENAGDRINAKLLRQIDPILYERVATPSKRRVLRLKKART